MNWSIAPNPDHHVRMKTGLFHKLFIISLFSFVKYQGKKSKLGMDAAIVFALGLQK